MGYIEKIEVRVKNFESEYIHNKTFETILKNYVENHTVVEMQEQMKQMPTMSALELRLLKVG